MSISIQNSCSHRPKSRGKCQKPNAEDIEIIEHNFGEKLSLDKPSGSQRKTKPVLSSQGKLPLPRRKKTKETKAKENPKDVEFPFDETKKAKKRNRHFSCMDDDEEFQFTGSIDKHTLTEAMERKEDLDDLFFRHFEGWEATAREYANVALSYMHNKGNDLELVKAGFFNTGDVSEGFRVHLNFKAKRTNDPSAPVETYFAQLYYHITSTLAVELCVSLGESETLPYERDNGECEICYLGVHHPEGGCKGIIWGHWTWSPEEDQFLLT